MFHSSEILNQFDTDDIFKAPSSSDTTRRTYKVCYRVKLKVWQGKNYSIEYSPWEESKDKLNRYIQAYLSEGFSQNCISLQRLDFTPAEDPCKKNPQPAYWTLINLRRE